MIVMEHNALRITSNYNGSSTALVAGVAAANVQFACALAVIWLRL